MPVTTIVIYAIMGFLVVASAVGMLLSRNAIYAAMFLVANFLTVAFMYLSLGAPFIALAQVTVYAGSIMVLFLFVIMLLGGEKLPFRSELRRQWWIGGLLGIVFLIEIGIFVVMRGNPGGIIPLSGLTFSTPGAIGQLLFSKYLLPFEITSVLLLAAVIGAIFLTRVYKQQKLTTTPTQKEKEG